MKGILRLRFGSGELRTRGMELVVWADDMNDAPERREAYRYARINITGLCFLVMEPRESEISIPGFGAKISWMEDAITHRTSHKPIANGQKPVL